MKKIFAAFKSLPPEVRMMIALAGFGTPAAMIYGIKMFLFPDISYRLLILIIGGLMLLIAGGGFLISKGFKRGGKKRARNMESALAGEADRGPVSMDVRAAIKSNNDKFFTAIRDMRKNVGISVYDLPWYIVMGDSGCGKTKLVNEGGLTFSTGKPEGYQLGTLNYNWWFSEDAIFVDMAGRLCNPQDDADRKEWQAFLDTIGKGRKGYPINGALVCVSAEHLLADPPEKQEADANTTLERLRDLQSRLGLTFATYLVVTKCDKIPGFMQFFDRAERDITVKNQIFGWSKPGEFNELRDPEEFVHDFNTVYARLNDLRLRRLHDEADEIDLGLAYGFPEEFRQFKEPLSTYVRTLFPMIKNPRAIKNLIFRGVYFTSATQEGELILRHLTERLGPDAADQFPRLDLYPNKRPHFIKDLLFRKVFPEHGLVFRNEQQAVRNKQYGNLLRIGSVALSLLLFGVLGLSFSQFSKVIGKPRDDAKAAKPDQPHDVPVALTRSSDLTDDIAKLESNLVWARMLSFPWGARGPIQDLGTIRAGVFEKFLLRPAMERVSNSLRNSTLGDPRDGEKIRTAAKAYVDALEHYLCWLGCAGEASPPECVNFENFKTMYNLGTEPTSQPAEQDARFMVLAEAYFKQLKDQSPGRNPARLLRHGSTPAEETVRIAVAKLSKHLEGYARLDRGHPNQVIGEWMRIFENCAGIEGGYGGMLTSGKEMEKALSREQLTPMLDGFVRNYEGFDKSLKDCAWTLPATGGHVKIDSLRETILQQRELWIGYEARLKGAYAKCTASSDSKILNAIAAISKGDKEMGLVGLDPLLWSELRDRTKLAHKDYDPTWFDKERIKEAVKEVYELYDHIILPKGGGGKADDTIALTNGVALVQKVLQPIGEELRVTLAQWAGLSQHSTPSGWVTQLETLLDRKDSAAPKDPQLASLDSRWRREQLESFQDSYRRIISKILGSALLNDIRKGLSGVGEWGIAEVYPENERWAATSSAYGIPMPTRSESSPERPPVTSAPAKEKEKEKAPAEPAFARPSLGPRDAAAPAETAPPAQPAPKVAEPIPVVTGVKVIPASCSRAFFFDRMDNCYRLLYYLGFLGPSHYLGSEHESPPLHLQCRDLVAKAGRAYAASYVRTWAKAYQDKRLAETDGLVSHTDSWATLNSIMGLGGGGAKPGRDLVADEVSVAVSEVLANVAFWDWKQDTDKGGSTVWFQAGAPTNELRKVWTEVQGWVQDALAQQWGTVGTFVVDAPRAYVARSQQDARVPPWIAISNEIIQRWAALASAMEANAKLPREFGPGRPVSVGGPIPWGGIDGARRTCRLEGDKLTERLVAIEARAQELLSCELTSIVAGIQDRHFAGERGSAGWPYLDVAGLRTVDFAAFKNFLGEVESAAKDLAVLEEKLPPNLPYLDARVRFYASCRGWQDFISQAVGTQGLGMNVQFIDPVGVPECKNRIDDTAQQYYNFVELDLGSGKPMRIPTTRGGAEAATRGGWSIGAANAQLRISWVDGIRPPGAMGPYPDKRTDLGASSALAFCAYLRRDGFGRAEKWITCHGFNLIDELKSPDKKDLALPVNEKKPVIGVGLEFTLDRPIPEPIPVLADCRSAAAARSGEKNR